jgi:hypothetical protein
MKSQQKRQERRMPSEAMAFMKQPACDRLAEAEVILVAKFEHAANRFLAARVRKPPACGMGARRPSTIA